MKQKISITLEKNTLKSVKNLLKKSVFRNRSHIIEHSLKELLNKYNKEK